MFFQSLSPILAHAKLNLIITSVKEDKISIVLIPTPNMADSLLSKPMSFIGTAAELDAQLLDQLFEISNDYADLSLLISQQKSALKDAKNEAAKASVAKTPAAQKAPTQVASRGEKKADTTVPDQTTDSGLTGIESTAQDDEPDATSSVEDTHTLSLF